MLLCGLYPFPSVLLYNVAAYLQMIFGKLKALAWVTEILKGIGRHSIVYVCLNQIIIIVWNALLSPFEIEEVAVTKLVVRLGVLVLTVVSIEVLEKCFKISNITKLKIVNY